MCVGIGDIDHAGIHTDIANDRTTVAINHDLATTIAEMTVQAVGIADRDNRDAGIALYIAHPAVADGITCRNVLYLQDSRLQCADVTQPFLTGGTDSIQADAETYHIHLIIGEPFYSGRVQDMLDHLVFQPGFQFCCHAGERIQLLFCEIVEDIGVAAYEMRKYGASHYTALFFQATANLRYIFRLEA